MSASSAKVRKADEAPVEYAWIAASLRSLAVPIDSLTIDPANARVHPERNLAAIENSLRRFGQRKTIVVQRQGMVVRAGNGTVEAAKRIGWTHVAAVVVDETDLEATAFGIADNRTAELALWDQPVLTSLLETLQASGEIKLDVVGFTDEELAAMTASADGDPPDDFPEKDSTIDTECTCPKCGYKWSGKTK